MGKIKATATNEHGSAYAYLTVSSPKILSVARVNAAKKKKMNKAKYGVKACLQMDTQDSCRNCSLLVAIHCDDWKDDYIKMLEITTKSAVTTIPEEQTFFEFTPNVEWLKDSNKSSGNMVAKIYLVSCWMFSLRPPDAELARMAEAFEQNKTEYQCLMFLHGNYLKQDTKETEKIPVSKIVIVIDPGHGWSTGYTGTECRQFCYYEKNTKGEKDINKTKTDTAFNLPDYVLQNIEYWIANYVSITRLEKKYHEWFYVIDVSLLLKKELEKENRYKVLMTRAVEKNIGEQISGEDTYTARHKIPNDNNADYFISIHCDGASSFKNSGAFVLYPRNKDTNSRMQDVEKSRIFARDIKSHYKALNLDSKPVQQPGNKEGEGKFVLKSGNKTQRRILVELGRMTNPNDILKLYEADMQENTAKHLAEGIIFNITNSYAKE